MLRGRRLAGLKFRRQQPLGRYVADFFCERARLVVELDGESHFGQEAKDAAREANVLVTVSGQELLDEEMIKLPINIANSNQKSWKNVLTAARDRRAELHKLAEKHYRASDRAQDPVRPIVLVQVERTGKDQREARFVHSEDVKTHLMQRLGVDERKIAIKTAEKDDIEGIDLVDSECPVEWIITKAAVVLENDQRVKDFIVQKGEAQRELPLATVFVVESKGRHLKGSEDTTYKREIARVFEEVGHEDLNKLLTGV